MNRLIVNRSVIELLQGDITAQTVDAIVNAANSQLMGGGGVDGAIHRKGGPEIMRETDEKYPDGCPTGSAVISGAGRLLCKYVIHAVGPVWSGGNRGEANLLAAAIEKSLQLAAEHDCQSIALPALSCGAYGFPLNQASRTMLKTTADFLKSDMTLEVVRFVLFDARGLAAFQKSLALVKT